MTMHIHIIIMDRTECPTYHVCPSTNAPSLFFPVKTFHHFSIPALNLRGELEVITENRFVKTAHFFLTSTLVRDCTTWHSLESGRVLRPCQIWIQASSCQPSNPQTCGYYLSFYCFNFAKRAMVSGQYFMMPYFRVYIKSCLANA